MSLESRGQKSEIRNAHAALTPSELAALLGPCATHVPEPLPVVPDASTSRWTLFAEEFARGLTARLRPLIRAAVRVTFSGSHTLTAEDLATSQADRDVVSLWQSAHSIEPLAVVLSVPLAATFVDRLLGGRSAPNCDAADLRRPLTEVDQRLAARLGDTVRLSVSEQVELTEFSDHEGSLAEAWLPDSSLVRLSFDLRFVQGGGVLDLLLPIEIAESLADQPDSAVSEKTPQNRMSEECQNAPPRHSLVVAQLSQTTLSRSEQRALAVGDVLLMPANLDQSVRVFVDGHPKFDGIAGTMDGHKAIRLMKTGSVRAS